MQTVKLNNGVLMPMEGFGVFQVDDLKTCEESVLHAIKSGYRLIDTAFSYNNEEAVGNAIKKSGVPREELFITTKAFIQQMGYENTRKAFDESLEKLGLEYLDLYLVHQPFGDYYGSWRAMEELYEEGKVRAIGVSNFLSDRLIDLCYNAKVIPTVNQLELHPFYQRDEELAVMREYGIVPEAWAPFAEGMNGMFKNPVLCDIAKAHGKTAAQVILRWNIQRGVAVIPKSVHKNRIEENAAIWDFSLTDEDMARISKLDLGHPQMLDPLKVSEVHRLYNYLRNPVLTSLQ